MVTQAQREVRVVQDESVLSSLLDTARFEHMYRIAEAMASGSFIPEHIYMVGPKNDRRQLDRKQVVGNCFRIVNQAIRWGLDPWSVIDETYVVAGKLGYQGKLIAAVINARAGFPGGLKPMYNTKKGGDFAVVVYASQFPPAPDAIKALMDYAENEDRKALGYLTAIGILAVRLSVAQAITANDMWKRDPEQKLFYSAAPKWARRWRPEIMLGVVTDDDLDRMQANTIEATPQMPLGVTNLRNDGQTVPGYVRDESAASQQTSQPETDGHGDVLPDSPSEPAKDQAPTPTPDQEDALKDVMAKIAQLKTFEECQAFAGTLDIGLLGAVLFEKAAYELKQRAFVLNEEAAKARRTQQPQKEPEQEKPSGEVAAPASFLVGDHGATTKKKGK